MREVAQELTVSRVNPSNARIVFSQSSGSLFPPRSKTQLQGFSA
jgi:hypothetical protein